MAHKFVTAAIVTIVGSIALSSVNIVEARVLPWAKKGGTSAPAKISTQATNTVIVQPGFMPGRGGIRVYFGNLQNAKSVSYTLSYETNGKAEGVSGSVSPSDGNSTTRELLFGTCSTGVCTPHKNIKNMKLEVKSQLTSGKTAIKRFRIKV